MLFQKLNNFIGVLLDFIDYLLTFLRFLDGLSDDWLIVAEFSKTLA
jgi:hypothetical protein